MDKGLLIRATSVQHTAYVIQRLQNVYPGTKIDIMTHPHASESVKDLLKEGSIIPYRYKGNFSLMGILITSLLVKLRQRNYDMVIIPTENTYGTGYENVIALAVFLLPKQVVLCNKGGEISIMSLSKSILLLAKTFFYYPFALINTIALAGSWAWTWTKTLTNSSSPQKD